MKRRDWHRELQQRMTPFSGMETAIQEQANGAATVAGEDLTAKLHEPGKDISAAAGRMERDSPLFYGTGENPLLF